MVFVTLNFGLLGMLIEWIGDASGHSAIAKSVGFVWVMTCIGLIVGSPAITFMKAKKRALLPWPKLLPRLFLFSLLIWMNFIIAADQVNPWIEHLITALFGCCAFILSMLLSDRWHKLWDNVQKKTVEQIAARKKVRQSALTKVIMPDSNVPESIKFMTIVVRKPIDTVEREALNKALEGIRPFQTAASLEDEMTILERIEMHPDFPEYIGKEARS